MDNSNKNLLTDILARLLNAASEDTDRHSTDNSRYLDGLFGSPRKDADEENPLETIFGMLEDIGNFFGGCTCGCGCENKPTEDTDKCDVQSTEQPAPAPAPAPEPEPAPVCKDEDESEHEAEHEPEIVIKPNGLPYDLTNDEDLEKFKRDVEILANDTLFKAIGAAFGFKTEDLIKDINTLADKIHDAFKEDEGKEETKPLPSAAASDKTRQNIDKRVCEFLDECPQFSKDEIVDALFEFGCWIMNR